MATDILENNLDASVEDLANNQLDSDYISAEIERIEQELERTELGHQLALLKEEMKQIKTEEQAYRAKVSEAALNYFGSYAVKQVHPAVTVQERKVFDYQDSDMFEYALGHNLAALLQLNKRNAKALAKTGTLEFVEEYTDRRVAIKKDLSEWANVAV